ncbi:BAG family molecular chaperone regulator 1-like [Cynara cardunculus var. scolymus]|uniref:Ubiquitin n=1 Tax=Cynara cardunculus var. scolymus TaxID=59895 RepID=A0A103XLA0_CYNCS|nr:BAG family molecular chaperone regulator 1-like [Cynara cardunculus var. scolymus]KVH92824.1 Ubiquitin [Cynara cardunculus var. scolymus]
MKLKPKRFSRSFSRFGGSGSGSGGDGGGATVDIGMGETKWELRPGGMLVQRREIRGENDEEEIITIRVTTVSQWHDVPTQATSTFGELKMILSTVTGMEIKEQRLLFKGKEREDGEHLHMVGVRNNDKVLLLQDPAIKEKKRLGLVKLPSYRTIIV